MLKGARHLMGALSYNPDPTQPEQESQGLIARILGAKREAFDRIT